MLKRSVLKSFYCLENFLAMKSYYWFFTEYLFSTFLPLCFKALPVFVAFNDPPVAKEATLQTVAKWTTHSFSI